MPNAFSVDLTNLEKRFATLGKRADAGLEKLFGELQTEAEDAMRALLNLQVYDTPERGYDRTRALWRSVYAIRVREGPHKLALVVGAVGGARGRSYALYVERGTYGGRVSLDQIKRDAIAVGRTLIHLEYGDPSSGMEARPFTIPTVVMIVNSLPPRVLDVIREADRNSRQARG